MKKIKFSVGVLAFMGLVAINFTQSESCFVSKALASTSNSSGIFSNIFSSFFNTDSYSGYATNHMLKPQECRLQSITEGGKTETIYGTRFECVAVEGQKCDQNKQTICKKSE